MEEAVEVSEIPKDKLEPHLTATVGSHLDIWHRFTKPNYEKRGRDQVVVLNTKCGLKIYDHWNTRQAYDPRYDNYCARCFPNGITSEGRAKPAPGNDGAGTTSDVPGKGHTSGGQQGDTEEGRELTSTAEPLVSEDSDAGDAGAAHSEGSGVQRAGHEGHVEELPKSPKPGDPSVGRGDSEEAGQGKSDRESGTRQSKQPARTEGKPKAGTS